MVRLAIVLGAALLLAAPRVASAQVYCASGATAPSGYSSFVPTGYSSYSGFASFPGATASGTLPGGYNTNPYTGCAPTTASSNANPYDPNANATRPPTYSAVIASNVYNPYSGWGLTNPASYPFVAYGNNAASSSSAYGPTSLYSGYAGFPGIAPSGYLTTGTSSSTAVSASGTNVSAAPASASSATASPFGAPTASATGTVSYGGYTPAASPSSASSGGGYFNAGGVPIYYGGANGGASSGGSGAGVSAGYSSVATGAGLPTNSGGAGYYTYGPYSSGAVPIAPDPGSSTTPVDGCGGAC